MTIYNADCMEILPQIQDKSIDMILCDLPYGTTACEWDRIIPMDELWEQYRRVIKDNGVIALFSKQPFTSRLVLSASDIFRYELIWEKSRVGNNMQLGKQFAQIHENIDVFYKKQPKFNEIRYKVDEKYVDKRKSINDAIYSSEHYKGVMHRKKDDGFRHAQSILPFNSVWNKDMHPTQKPVELLEYLIRTYTDENDVVLDNCMGSGSTGVACANTDRQFIGIEKEEQYFTMAKERLDKAQSIGRLDGYVARTSGEG